MARRRKLKQTKAAKAARRRYRAKKRPAKKRLTKRQRAHRRLGIPWKKGFVTSDTHEWDPIARRYRPLKRKRKKVGARKRRYGKRVSGYRPKHSPRAPVTVYDQQVREHVNYLNALRRSRGL